jgi:predicted P-loop ATPase/GTPase
MSSTPRKILVVGLLPYDAGKTTLCRALIYGFKEAGINLVPFKPHSGISYWYQFDSFEKSAAEGTLLSSDIRELNAAAESQIPLEVLNPVNRLSGPAIDRRVPEKKLVFEEFIAERFTYHDGLTHRDIYYLNGTLNLDHVRGMQSFSLRIERNAQKTRHIHNFEELVKAYSENFDRATSSCYRRIQNNPLVVESFNDAAYPFTNAQDCNTVLCASSNTVLLLEKHRYFQAIESNGRQKPKLQLTVSNVYSSSLIRNKFIIQPLSAEERDEPSKLKKNYSEVIKQVLENA